MAFVLQESIGTPAGSGTNLAAANNNVWLATQWQANANYRLTQIGLSLWSTTGCNATFTAHVWSDDGATNPDANTVVNSLNTLPGANLTNTFTEHLFQFSGVNIVNGTLYWLGVNANAVNGTAYAQWQVGSYLVADQSDQSANGVTWFVGFDRKMIARTYVTAGATMEQEGYRWRKDDGNEATATWAANQDTAITTPPNTVRRLRVLINSNGDANAAEFQLEVKKTNEANYVAIA